MPSRFCIAILFLAFLSGSLHAQKQFTAYQCQHQSAEQLEKMIRPRLPAGEELQLIVDNQRNQLLLSGSEAVHDLFRQVLNQSDVPLERSSIPLAEPLVTPSNAKTESNRAAQQTATIAIAIKVAEINSLIQQLQTIFEPRLSTITPGRVYELSVREPSIRTSLIFDPNNGRMVLSGPTTIIGQLKSLVERLSEQSNNGYRVQVHRLQRENHSSLRDAVRTINDQRSGPSRTLLQNDQSRFTMPPGSMIRPVVFQTTSDQGNSKPAEQALRQFEGVEIESLPDMDVILLLGRQPDLDQLA